ncbi:hypothetical protein ILUMI_04624 [Ignelater luminosus]|uniref:Uncharacterized protein n=1 Tax=Ignelater luminosus TaxID=2038154 RepID=A0A8K0DEF5_IGNLU|nr:hypothetical protein ILUMI_04624 [Ignelater luminosus]
MKAQLFDLKIKEFRTLIFQLAERNNFPHPIKHEAAGRDWVPVFLTRHPADEQTSSQAELQTSATHLAVYTLSSPPFVSTPAAAIARPGMPRPKNIFLKATPPASSSIESDKPVKDNECLYCHDYLEEEWIRCSSCAKWARNSFNLVTAKS